ncbi:hypothetical protein KI387_007115 [Taxus chinensis]|uniref:Jacalin-type lectin domain-containing protein n=1 Tax=Taxus chinensis TaxID=29808 RepID=A0AA38GNS4_TAXCH|nr:hypothetical protein KI387_007115 [Taxus chinensis]
MFLEFTILLPPEWDFGGSIDIAIFLVCNGSRVIDSDLVFTTLGYDVATNVGNGGSPWDDGVYTGIKQIVIVHAAAIDSIRIEYDKNGRSVWSDKHGGNGGTKTDKIVLDYPNEILTSLSGHSGHISHGSPCVIRSLTFHSNLRKFGPYGVEQGTYFTVPMSGGKMTGLNGQSGWLLDSIGVCLSHSSQNSIWSTIKDTAVNIIWG